MALLTKNALLAASDLVEREVELPSIGGSVKVRSLPAAYSNQAAYEAMEMTSTPKGDQIFKVNTAKLEVLQVLHGMVEPKLDSVREAEAFAEKCGPAFKTVVAVIDEISGIDKEALEDAHARFPGGGESAGRPDLGDEPGAGNGRSDLPARAGVGAEDAGGRDV